MSLKQSATGVMVTPAHVHKAIREYVGIEEFATSIGLGLADVDSLPLFDPLLDVTA